MSGSITLARPYAKAVFAHAKSLNELKNWSIMLKTASCVVENKDFLGFVKNPRVNNWQIIGVFVDLVDQFCINLIELLVMNNRILLLPEITTLYEHHRADAENTLDITIISAFEITKTEQEIFSCVLRKRFGRSVILHCSIDPTLIAGMVIRAGDKIIDGSTRGRLARLTKYLVS